MVPMALLAHSARPADYLHTGYWSGKALPEARREGLVRTVWSGADCGFARLPADDELEFAADAPYLHYVSNETVEGLQFARVLGRDDVPRICDMSSDFLSAPGDYGRFALIYAHAQKNLGPAGVTVVAVKDALLAGIKRELPGFLDYRAQAEAHSIFNTPPVFAIYVVLLVTRWLRDEIGGLAAMDKINSAKAALLYRALDDSDGFYRGRAARADRSRMNVAFNLPDAATERAFLEEAEAAGFSGLAGHRSVGGIRASLYNGLELEAVARLVEFMEGFRRARW
jgi:phosphoserine aminotransferase